METAGIHERLMQEKRRYKERQKPPQNEDPAIASNQLQPWYLEINCSRGQFLEDLDQTANSLQNILIGPFARHPLRMGKVNEA